MHIINWINFPIIQIIDVVQLMDRSKWFHGLAANIIWALHSIEQLGVISFDVQIIFVSTMIIIGIGHCSMYLNSVYVTNCMQWWLKDPEYFTSVNGEFEPAPYLFKSLNFHLIKIIENWFCWNFSGVHHKKKNCESNQVISKVQQVLKIATKSKQLYPMSLTLTVASVVKKSKLRKGNGGWGDKRDHNLCLNVTWTNYY